MSDHPAFKESRVGSRHGPGLHPPFVHLVAGQGPVPNLAHPGGNITGFTSFEFSIGTKWLEVLKQTAPRVTRIALLFNPGSAPFADLFLRPVESDTARAAAPIAYARARAELASARGPRAGLHSGRPPHGQARRQARRTPAVRAVTGPWGWIWGG